MSVQLGVGTGRGGGGVINVKHRLILALEEGGGDLGEGIRDVFLRVAVRGHRRGGEGGGG